MGASHHTQLTSRSFTDQAASFNASAVANAAEILDVIVECAAPQRSQRWLELACGPGAVGRRLAPYVKAIHGIDVTPAMIETARREAASRGLENTTFAVGDAADTGLEPASFDGAVTRFSLHHIPVPARVVAELHRVVRPGGTVVIVDHLADDGGEARAWSQEIERLRDPSHWASLSASRIRTLGRDAGLELVAERRLPYELDFDDWLARGTADAGARRLVQRALAQRPDGVECFDVRAGHGGRVLTLQIWVGRWRRP